jgi:hypothetical protein
MKKVWWYGYGAKFAAQVEGLVDLQFARTLGQRLRGAIRSAGSLVSKRL